MSATRMGGMSIGGGEPWLSGKIWGPHGFRRFEAVPGVPRLNAARLLEGLTTDVAVSPEVVASHTYPDRLLAPTDPQPQT